MNLKNSEKIAAGSGTALEPLRLTLAFNWKLSLLGLLMLPVLLRLGFWQLQRAEEKQQLNDFQVQQNQLPALNNLSLFQADSVSHRRVLLSGHFDNQHYWLLDNKTWQGRVGYQLLMPFRLVTGELLLVNRGWLAAPRLRTELPAVEPLAGMQTLSGSFYLPQKNRMIKNGDEANAWPKRIQQLDIGKMQTQLGHEFAVAQSLRLDETSDAALNIQWQWLNSSVAKHQGYAVQWFSMAGALAVLLVFANSNLAQVIATKITGRDSPARSITPIAEQNRRSTPKP